MPQRETVPQPFGTDRDNIAGLGTNTRRCRAPPLSTNRVVVPRRISVRSRPINVSVMIPCMILLRRRHALTNTVTTRRIGIITREVIIIVEKILRVVSGDGSFLPVCYGGVVVVVGTPIGIGIRNNHTMSIHPPCHASTIRTILPLTIRTPFPLCTGPFRSTTERRRLHRWRRRRRSCIRIRLLRILLRRLDSSPPPWARSPED